MVFISLFFFLILFHTSYLFSHHTTLYVICMRTLFISSFSSHSLTQLFSCSLFLQFCHWIFVPLLIISFFCYCHFFTETVANGMKPIHKLRVIFHVNKKEHHTKPYMLVFIVYFSYPTVVWTENIQPNRHRISHFAFLSHINPLNLYYSCLIQQWMT